MTKTSTRYSPEVRDRAVRLVQDYRKEYPSAWAAMGSIASKIGCSPETLRKWVRRAECDTGKRSGPTSDDLARFPACSRIAAKVGHGMPDLRADGPADRGLKALERENRQLRQANEILRPRLFFGHPHFFCPGGARRTELAPYEEMKMFIDEP